METLFQISKALQSSVLKLLENLNPSKVCGLDKIPTWVLKELSLEVAHILAVIFNTSILTGCSILMEKR